MKDRQYAIAKHGKHPAKICFPKDLCQDDEKQKQGSGLNDFIKPGEGILVLSYMNKKTFIVNFCKIKNWQNATFSDLIRMKNRGKYGKG